MKKIALPGDSIRLGHEASMKVRLAGIAEVWSPEDNCLRSTNRLINAYTWYVAPEADAVHFDFGIWDCLRIACNPTQHSVPAEPVLRRHDVQANDLHEFVCTYNLETLICRDGVHYTGESYWLLGERVAEQILHAAINTKPSHLHIYVH